MLYAMLNNNNAIQYKFKFNHTNDMIEANVTSYFNRKLGISELKI